MNAAQAPNKANKVGCGTVLPNIGLQCLVDVGMFIAVMIIPRQGALRSFNPTALDNELMLTR